MSDAMNVDISFDPGQLAALERKLGPALYEKAVANLLIDATNVAVAVAIEKTPGSGVGPTGIQRTGHARRSTTADQSAHEVYGRYPYFNWLDKGTDSRGRVMLSRPDGYQITRQTRERVGAALPKLIDKCGREVADRWGE